jgi:hypothetical protein
VVAVVTFVIVFMAVNVSTQKLSIDTTFVYSALSLTNMIRLAITVLAMVQLFRTKSFAFTTRLVAILNFLRVYLEQVFQLKQS